jgi:thiosulfate/3-mercaptopyruvate sulfurtransferase
VDVTLEELVRRLDDDRLVLIDVRTADEHAGRLGAACDPRQGSIPGSRNLPLEELFELDAESLRKRVGEPLGTELIAFCHSGSRSAMAVGLLCAAGYEARNYPGSWHEWSRADSLPIETR